MNEKLDSAEEFTSWEEVVYSNTVQNEALLRLLIKKGIMTEEEFIEESKRVDQAFQSSKGQ